MLYRKLSSSEHLLEIKILSRRLIEVLALMFAETMLLLNYRRKHAELVHQQIILIQVHHRF